MNKFLTIDYLKHGTQVQQKAWHILQGSKIMVILQDFSPVLAGTIPINIAISGSDLDIICCFSDKENFSKVLNNFKSFSAYEFHEKQIKGITTLITRFICDGVPIEIFGQNRSATKQEAYRHMLIEHEILQLKGEKFRLQVIDLKNRGIKTEPAFAQLLNLKGDPYEALLNYSS